MNTLSPKVHSDLQQSMTICVSEGLLRKYLLVNIFSQGRFGTQIFTTKKLIIKCVLGLNDYKSMKSVY